MRLVSLERVFKEACGKHEHLKLLESQWCFDKELISKALQNISSIFPHYSRHDSSHSKQIIVNIERMLGDRIHHLTATDMWLILESAYSHDIGMVVTQNQIKDMDTPAFNSFVQDIAVQPDHELYQFALKWQRGDASLPAGSAAHVFFDEYRQLLAEWYRRKHPENAAKIINDPFEQIGLTSPRNELLPKRLFRALSAICLAHGQPFETVLELPFSEAGMATEDCHPRYVAFLLRMADLLDVDDNRFCPVMMRMSGSSLPANSQAHLEKHQSIKHFRLDSERIKIEVVCPSPESYEVAHEWFKWLEKEYHSQSQHWLKIVPYKKLGRLPTLSPPRVSLEKPYVIIDEGRRPRFDLNQEAILKLLRGTGLYTAKTDSIREILQNAVDSTIVAIWEKHKEKIVTLDPSSEELFKIYDENMISVDFLKKPEDAKKFTLVVQDFGVGISKDDLEHMLKVGNSSKNSKKSRSIREMPDWFKPSGNFGIGLQSISLLSEKFKITTKSRATHEAFCLEFNLGAGSSVVIESLPPESAEYGATISVDITVEDFPKTISIPWGEERGALMEQMNDYDFTRPGSDLKIYEQIKIFQAVQSFNSCSPIKITTSQYPLRKEREGVYFSRKANISLSSIKFSYNDNAMLDTFFRGQSFSDLHLRTQFVSGVVDFYGHQAMDFLTYNREKILPQAKSLAGKGVIEALLEYIDSRYLKLDGNEKPCAAAFYFLNQRLDANPDKYIDDLMRFEVNIEGRCPMPLSEVLDAIAAGTINQFEVRSPVLPGYQEAESPISPVPETLVVLMKKTPGTALRLIKLLATKRGFYWQEQRSNAMQGVRCYWSKDDIQPVSDELIREIFSGERQYFEVGNRMFFPVWQRYRRLAVKVDAPWARIHQHHASNSEYLVLPYKFCHQGPCLPDSGEDLIRWVYEHRLNDDLTLDEIGVLYRNLTEDLNKIVFGGL